MLLQCAFCGRDEIAVKKLVKSVKQPIVCVCDECVKRLVSMKRAGEAALKWRCKMNICDLAKQTKALAAKATPGDLNEYNDSHAQLFYYFRAYAPRLADAVIKFVNYFEVSLGKETADKLLTKIGIDLNTNQEDV